LTGLTIDYSSDFNFPLLKTLHLDTVSFDGVCDGFLRLLNGCPILEDLEAKDLLVYSSSLAGYVNLLKEVNANILNLSFSIPI